MVQDVNHLHPRGVRDGETDRISVILSFLFHQKKDLSDPIGKFLVRCC